MRAVQIHEVENHFSEFVRDVEAGEELLIARGDELVARIIPIAKPAGKRALGYDVGKPFAIADDFDRFVPEEWHEYSE